MSNQNDFPIVYADDLFDNKEYIKDVGIDYVIVEPSSVKDLCLEDEFGNMRSISEISYLYKTMLIAGEDLDVVELIDYIPYIDSILSQAGSFYAVSGIVIYLYNRYIDCRTGKSYELNSDLDLAEV